MNRQEDKFKKISPFSSLTVKGPIGVKLIQSNEWSIEGKNTELDVLEQIYHYEGGKLVIDGRGWSSNSVVTQVISSGKRATVNIGNNNDNRTIINQIVSSRIGNISGSSIGSIVQVGVNNGTISTNELMQVSGDGLLITITAPEIPAVNLKGSGTVKIEGFANQTLDYRLEGSGDIIHHNVNVKKALLRVHGSGDIDLKGIASEVLAKLVGSGDIDVSDCITDHAKVTLTGSGDISVNAKKVSGTIKGSGDLHCTSAAKEIDVKVVGSGEVRQNRVQRK